LVFCRLLVLSGPVRLAWRPARLPPDQRQDSAVTDVAICVVCAIVVEKHCGGSGRGQGMKLF
ncbi:hypothetical protein, partial [Pseudomonas sp. SZ57]|uniref:hypothetical protein n=1 Tax=Pseudomonas sp. SZ57 TaxID=2662259 RepID=UPI001C4999CE